MKFINFFFWQIDKNICFSGKLIHNLGLDTDIDARTKAILMENDIDNEEFTDEVIRCLPGDTLF